MKRLFFTYLFPLFCLFAVSCTDDLSVRQETGEWNGGDGRSISVSVDVPETRTRAVDMTPGASLYLKKIWIGVYRKSDGKRVGGTIKGERDLMNLYVPSGNTLIDLVSIDLEDNVLVNTGPQGAVDKYCVVGVANYDGIVTMDGSTLYDKLKNANTWNDFINLEIDTRKSYFENQTPMLMGYLYKEDIETSGTDYKYTKVNQFNSAPGINLNGQSNDEDIFVSPKSANGYMNGINTVYVGKDGKPHNYILKLRRLSSKINVIINETPVEGITITNLQYKVFNNPRSSFLAQRRTNVFDYALEGFSGDATDAKYSPNSADVPNSVNASGDGYYDYDAWVYPQVNTEFSFEHFENKHWAKNKNNLNSYHDRELNDGKGCFTVLADETTDWNNNASYFVLKMNIRDENTGRNGEIEYTIHEGFCNDEDGLTLVNENGNSTEEQLKTRLLDFSCIRNTDYYYKVTVRGVNDVVLQVTTSDSHTNDEQGKVFQINYAKNTNKNYIESLTGNLEVDTPVFFKEPGDTEIKNSDIGFRFLGTFYDSSKRMEIPVDLCYNFKHGDLDGFAGIWTAPTDARSEYIYDTGTVGIDFKSAYTNLMEYYEGGTENACYFNELVDKILVKHQGSYINIIDYITEIQDEKVNPNIEGYKIDGLKYYEGFDGNSDNKRDHLRGLYIFDTQKAFLSGKRVETDAVYNLEGEKTHECSFLYQINALEQYPVYLNKENFEMKYATNSSTQKIPANANNNYTDFSDGRNGKGMLLSDQPEIAFRLLGFDGNTQKYIDIFYNLGLKDYSYYTDNNLWPDINLNNVYSRSIEKNNLNVGDIPQSFFDGIKIVKNGTEVYDIDDFIRRYENGNITLNKNDKLGFQVNEYEKICYSQDEAKKRSYMRALYLFDKKNKYIEPPIYNSSAHEATFQVYAAEQYPVEGTPDKLKLPDNLPTNINLTATNFLDEEVGNIVLPPIQGIDPSCYMYKLFIGNAECMVDVAPSTDGNFHYTIMMKDTKGTGGNIYVQAIPTVDEYTESDRSATSLGKVTLTNPKWDFASATWASYYRQWPAVSNNYYEFNNDTKVYDRLTLYASSGSKNIRGVPNSNLSLRNSGAGCDLKFIVYKDVKIIVKCAGLKDGNTMTAAGCSQTSFPMTTSTVTCQPIMYLNGYNYKDVTISSSGGIDVYSIELSPVD